MRRVALTAIYLYRAPLGTDYDSRTLSLPDYTPDYIMSIVYRRPVHQ